jgi:hypothetical protein
MSDIKIGIQITADSQDAALLELISKAKMVQAELKNTEGAADTTAKGFSSLGEGVKNLAAQLATLMGLRAAFNFFKEGAMDAMQEASLLQQTTANMISLTGATDDQVGSLDAYTTAVQMASGVSQDALYPALTKLGAATKDFALSQTLLEVATGAAARGIGTFEGNVDNLVRVLEGKGIRGTDAFSVALREMVVEGKLNADQLAILVKLYGDAGAAVDTEAMKLQRAKVAWGESKEAMGGAASAILTYLQPAMQVAATGIGMVAAGVIKLIGYLQAGGQAFIGFGKAADLARLGAFGAAKDALIENGEKVKAILDKSSLAADEMLTSVVTAWDKAPAMALKSKKEMAKEAKELQDLITGYSQGAPKESAPDQTVADLAKAYLSLKDAETAEARAALESADGKKAILATTDKLVSALDAQKDAEKALIQTEANSAVAAAKKDSDAILRIREAEKNKLSALDKKYGTAEAKAYEDAAKKQKVIGDKVTAEEKKDLDARVANAAKAGDKIEAAEKERQDEIKKYQKQRVSAERNLYGQLMGLASQYGGETIQQLVSIVEAADQLYTLWQTINEIFFAKKKIEELTGALSAQVTTKTADVTQGTMNANLWAINAAASAAAIPYVGWAIAPGAYAAALALGMSGVAAIAAVPMAAGGTLAIDPMLTMIGERGPELVLPNKFTRMFDRMADREATVNNTHNTHSVQRGGDVFMHVYNPIGGTTDNAYKKVERKMRVAKRANDRALANRPVTRIGPRGRGF